MRLLTSVVTPCHFPIDVRIHLWYLYDVVLQSNACCKNMKAASLMNKWVNVSVCWGIMGTSRMTPPPLFLPLPPLVMLLVDSNTGLDADGMRELCAALQENASLTELNLSRNRFGAEGAELLENALDRAPSLQMLDVRRYEEGGNRYDHGTST